MRIQVLKQGIESHSMEHYTRELIKDKGTVKIRLINAFVTLDGLIRIGSPTNDVLSNFLRRQDSTLMCVFGTQTVTSPAALKELRRLETSLGNNVKVKVFTGENNRLFHPKVYLFERRDGSMVAIIGSSNLTSGGLSNNLEVNIFVECLSQDEKRQFEILWSEVWNNPNVIPVNDTVIEEVQNRYRQEIKQRVVTARNHIKTTEEAKEIQSQAQKTVLVRKVPFAGNRTSQVHFTKRIVEEFFGKNVTSGAKIKLLEIKLNGESSNPEYRPIVYSGINKNPKIEFDGIKRIEAAISKTNIHPIITIQRLDTDFYKYIVLKSGDEGYNLLSEVLERQPTKGLALKYWLTDENSLLEVWNEYPR